MIAFIFGALVSIGTVGFMLNRLYVLFTRRQIHVKGILYSRAEQPVFYWFWAVAFTVGLCAGLGLLAMSTEILVGHNPFV